MPRHVANAIESEPVAVTGEAHPPSPAHAESHLREQGRRPSFRLLVLSSDTFPPRRVDVSVLFGVELASRGHTIDWILQSEAECARAYVTSWGGGRVWVAACDRGTSLLRRLRKHLLGIQQDVALFSLLRSGPYDAVEVKDKFLSGVLALIAARWYRKRFIFWLSYPFAEFYLSSAREGTTPYPLLYRIRGASFAFLLYRVLLPSADHVFVQSEQMRRDVAARGISLAKLTAVPMGIRVDDFALPDSGGRVKLPAGERCFLYLGALGRERRIDFLLRVLQQVRSREPSVKLYLVGEAERPADREFLVEEAGRLQVLDGVVFVGQLPQAEALRYAREADVCVSPIYPTPMLNPASPTKLVEYMALGKAVVANTHPEQRLLIEQSGCGYCVPWEESAFAEAILTLLAQPELARAMGERGRRYALEHRAYGRIADVVERELLRIAGIGRPEGRH